jgi:hypothetical protein
VSPQDPVVANRVGHFTLALSAAACALGCRGIPVLAWVAVYALSAFVASTAWREKPNLSPVVWFLGVLLFGGLTTLMYLIGVRVLGTANPPWLMFRLQWIIVPVLALISLSGFARALYVWFYRRGNSGTDGTFPG